MPSSHANRKFYVLNRPQKLFVICTAIFVTALVIAEATASKFFVAGELPFGIWILGTEFNSVIMTAGVISFPLTFIVTDLLNEYYGKRGIRFVTYVGLGVIVFEFVLLQVTMALPTADISPVSSSAFNMVFGATGRVILGSLTAYFIGQLVDIALFQYLRRRTGGRYLWLRATGSTVGSQFLDTFIVLMVAFAGQLSFQAIVAITLFNYVYKFIIAVLITPLIYLAHWLMDWYLGSDVAEALIQQAEAGPEVVHVQS